MAKSAKGRGTNRNRTTGTGERNDRLADFETRLGRARGSRSDALEAQARGSAMGTAFRISSELVVGLLVGGLIGWQLDRWFDTTPVFLLVFFILGAAAGIWNVIRTALAMQSDGLDAQAASKKPEHEPGKK
ncbi:MAG: AtpZ/AtpI family protein [Methyloligellaceae bacterium]